MKIAIVIEHFDPASGGMERSTSEIAGELVKRGHEVNVLAGSGKEGEGEAAGVKTIYMTEKKSSGAMRLARFAKWSNHQLEEGDYDTSLSVSMAAWGAVMQPRGGTVRETLERNIAIRGNGLKRGWKRLMVGLNAKQRLLLSLEKKHLNDERVKKVAAVSEYVVRQLRDHYGVASDRIVVVRNAAAMPEVSEEQKQMWRDAVRKQFNVPGDTTGVYLFAAQNPKLKGFGTVVEATRLLVEWGEHPTVLLVGKYGWGEQELIASKGVREHVRLVGETAEMPAMFAACDALVHPTFYDPSSKVVIESLMMGRPAISSGFNGASDWLRDVDGQPLRGFVVDDPGDVAGYAEAMIEVMKLDRYEVMRAACGGIHDELSMRRHVDELERMLEDAIEG
ncbi:glycosyltransferase family 4 protein [Poriferisphaera sp. WC338]|uniref:glycosyltransferase family 4 protein n=1 Tax=Poriferisphaera sp. WC338 TaxID=3425129 RepID=UPI003D81564F